MRMYSASGRSRWPYVIGAVIVVAVVAGVLVYTSTRPAAAPVAAPTPTVSTSPVPAGGASGAGDGEGDVAPTGCLGGVNRDAAMVLAAQKAAPHTTYGAIDVAAAFLRFVSQSPVPSASDVAAVQQHVVASDAPASFGNLAAEYQNNPNPSNGIVPDGTPFYLSTTNGQWMVGGESTPDQVVVVMSAGYVINGALSPTKGAAEAVVMQWRDGAWRFYKAQKPDMTKLTAGGTQFTGGC